MIKNIEFKNVPNQFQQQLRNDSKMILQSDKVIVAADKTNNLYKLPVKDYRKLLNDNITKTYKKASPAKLKNINTEAKQIASKLCIADRVQQYQKRSAFLTMKDHKPNFQNNTKCRLINPAKSEIGTVSKAYLDSINQKIRERINVNQWRSTSESITWFANLS